MTEPHDRLIAELVVRGGVVMMTGATDTGKTSMARQLLTAAVEAGMVAAYVDADVGQTTVGPPTCVGMRWLRQPADVIDLAKPDDLRFVGSITPNRFVLQQVVATASLVEVARPGADLIVIDTTGIVSGVSGQTLKYHKTELCRPATVVALQRGGEMEPIVGMLRRFFSAEVRVTGVHPDVVPVSPEQRAAHRSKRFADALSAPLERWRVRPTVFAPTLPAGLDQSRLDKMLVGVHDGAGRCLGLGVLSYDDDTLRVMTNVTEGMVGLRLGSLRIDLDNHSTEHVNLREVMFGL